MAAGRRRRSTFPPSADTEELFAYDEADLLRIAEAVGARSVNAIDVFGGDWSVDDAAAAFAGLCDRAAAHSLLAVAPVGVEMFSDELHRLGPAEAGHRAGATARDVLAHY
ncbi:MAG TPA: hypothetical protein VL769_13430 [Acidimicrobiia bacterium]|nr:hypothetical protein [Acidimicrobiia bacterium]